MRREFSKQVRRDAFMRASGKCENPHCGAHLSVGKFHYDHDLPDNLGGEPTLENCVVLCVACHKVKTREKDRPAIDKSRRIADRAIGIRKQSTLRGAGFRKAPAQRSASRPLERRTQHY